MERAQASRRPALAQVVMVLAALLPRRRRRRDRALVAQVLRDSGLA